MRSIMEHIRDGAALRFAERAAAMAGLPVSLLAHSTEEVEARIARGDAVKMFQTAPGQALASRPKGPPVRLEENYLYSTRRFAAGALAAAEYRFFTFAIGADPAAAGFQAGITNVSELETNLDVASVVPYGKNFVFRQIGVSVNADAVVADVQTLMESGWLRFTKQGDQFALRHGPIAMWPGGTGAWASSNTTSAANGDPNILAVRTLRVPRTIRQQENFMYSYVVPRTVRNTDQSVTIELDDPCILRIWLWGGQADVIPG